MVGLLGIEPDVSTEEQGPKPSTQKAGAIDQHKGVLSVLIRRTNDNLGLRGTLPDPLCTSTNTGDNAGISGTSHSILRKNGTRSGMHLER